MPKQIVGYSGTPLFKKLGIKEIFRVGLYKAPDGYFELLGDIPVGVEFVKRLTKDMEIVHLFINKKSELKKECEQNVKYIKQDGMIWVSWYKKASKLPTEITEDTVREVALQLGLVDVKVWAVDENWSSLKLVIRKENRK